MRRLPQANFYRRLDREYVEDYAANALLTVRSTTLLDTTRPAELPMELNTDDLDCCFYEDLLSEEEVVY